MVTWPDAWISAHEGIANSLYPFYILQKFHHCFSKTHSEFCSFGLISICKSLLYHCCLPFDCFPVCLWSLPTLYSQHNVQVWFKTQTDLLPLLLKGLPLVPILFKGSESRGKEETVREGKGARGGETEGMESRYDRLERSCLFETQHYTINVCH